MITDIDVFKEWGTFDVALLLEEFSHIGICPALLNNDDGKWLVSSDGSMNFSLEDGEEFECTHYVDDPKWYKSIKEAVYAFAMDEDTLDCKRRKNDK